MSLAAINSQYVGLNGLAGFNTPFAGGIGASSIYSDAYVDNAKTSIANAYDISATSSSYSNKSSVSSSSFAQQCQAIEYLLQQGRTDDAMGKYKSLYDDMASNSYYQGYTENEIKTLLQQKYMDATGTTIVNDIAANSSSAFDSGMQSSLPLVGLLFNNKSSDDFIAEATGTRKSNMSRVKTAAGVATTAAASAAGAVGFKTVMKAIKNTNARTTFTQALKNAAKGGKAGKILAGCLAAGAAILTFVGGKIAKSEN